MPVLPNHAHGHAGLPDHPQWSSLVGIITSIVGNILISVALNTQRYAHIKIDQEYRDKQDPEAKKARKNLPKSLRQYGAVVQQEEVAEERQRINEDAEVPAELTGSQQDIEPPKLNGKMNGKRNTSDDTLNGEENDDDKEQNQRKSYLKSPWWWLGIALMAVGETGNFLAYGFAPASIVSPLGVVGLISNCLIAPLMLKERFRQRDFWGVLIAIAGAVAVVLSAKTSEKKLGPDGLWADIKRWEFLAYVLITVILIVVLMILSPKYGQRTIMIDLGLVGLFGGYTALSTKGVASLLSTSLYRALGYPIMYVLLLILVGSAVMQIRYLNRGLQNFASTEVIPVQFVLFTLSVIIGSAVLYRDFERTDVDHVLKFIFGCLLTFSGVYLITSGRKHDDDDDDDLEGSVHQDTERIRLLDEETEDQEATPVKQERDLKIDTDLQPQTPRSSRTPSAVPSISITPAAASADDLNKNPWLYSSENLARTETNESDRPQTPVQQTIPAASSSQTPFFTPQTTQRAPENVFTNRLSRTISSPSHPETPTRRGPSPPKPHVDEYPSTLKRASISRLFPGPILQPLSSSLSGIVADRIRRGEGTSSPIRSPLRRHRSNREATHHRSLTDADLETGVASAFASEGSLVRARDAQQAQAALNREDSPLLIRRAVTGSGDGTEGGEGIAGSLKRTKGRLRSMSETLTNFMTGRRSSKDDEDESAASRQTETPNG